MRVYLTEDEVKEAVAYYLENNHNITGDISGFAARVNACNKYNIEVDDINGKREDYAEFEILVDFN